MKLRTFPLLALLLSLFAVGCVSTRPASSASTPAALSAPRSLADYSVEAHDTAYLLAAVYVGTRESFDPRDREVVRQVFVAFDDLCADYVASQGHGAETVATNLVDAVLDRVEFDRSTRPLVRALVKKLVNRLESNGLHLAALENDQLWRVVLAVRGGIRDSLTEAGVDWTQPVEGSDS